MASRTVRPMQDRARLARLSHRLHLQVVRAQARMAESGRDTYDRGYYAGEAAGYREAQKRVDRLLGDMRRGAK